MKDYEVVIIFKNSINEERVDALVARFAKKVNDNGGEFIGVDKMGRKRLPYRFQKHKNDKDGLYLLFKFKGAGRTPIVLRDDINVQEDVLRSTILVSAPVVETKPEAGAKETHSDKAVLASEGVSGESQ